MIAYLWESLTVAAVTLVVFAVMLGPLQKMFAARPQQRAWREDSAVDLAFFFGQYLVWSALALLALHQIHGVLDGAVPRAWRRDAASWPLAVQVGAAVVLGDLLVYGWHRACHAVPLLWRFHAVHHTSARLDWLAAHREHPLDGLTTQLAQNLPAMVLGLSLGEVGALVVLRGVWGAFIHSNVRLDVGWLRFVMGAPALHHDHHGRDEARVMNFANLAPWIDVVFGTYRRPAGVVTGALGLDAPAPRGYLALLVWPFRRVAKAPPVYAVRAARRSALPLPPMGSSASAQVAQRRGSL